MFRRILVPVDGSDASRQALAQAAELAAESPSRVRLLHVVDTLYYANDFERPEIYFDQLLPAMMRSGRKVLKAAIEVMARRDLPCETELIQSSGVRVADTILEDARRWRADLIVMGTHGRRGFNRLVLGSDAESVIRRCALPVLLVKAEPPPAAQHTEVRTGEQPMYQHILLAVDGSDTSLRALSHAIELAKAQHASLLAIYVVEYPSAIYSSAYIEIAPFHEAVMEEGRHVLAKAQASMNEAGVNGQTRLIDPGMLSSGVADEIEKVALEIKADVVVLGTHGRRGFRRLMMGSVAEAFVRQAHCPVILVPHHEQVGFETTP